MIDLNGKLGLHAAFRTKVEYVGAERAPVIIVDDFLGAPELLIESAACDARFELSVDHYPGLRAAIPPIYSFALRAFLGKIIGETFGIASTDVIGGTCGYAIATTPAEKLSIVQRLPHFDSINPKQIALLHFLCPGEKGGTSFYRHRRTGYETIDAARLAGYTAAVNGEISAFGPPPMRYIDGDDAMFERIAAFDAAFNRVLIYRSASLHSAAIRPGFHFDADPRTGRLTANTLFIYR